LAASLFRHRVAAVRIVDAEHATLVVSAGGAAVFRVERVAVYLDGATVVAGGVDADRDAVQLHGSRVARGRTRNDALGTARHGDDLVFPPAAASEARHGEGGTHHLHEPATAWRIWRELLE